MLGGGEKLLGPAGSLAQRGLLLGERVRGYRWTAVILGLIGVMVILAPHLSVREFAAMSGAATLGASAEYQAAGGGVIGVAIVQVRREQHAGT